MAGLFDSQAIQGLTIGLVDPVLHPSAALRQLRQSADKSTTRSDPTPDELSLHVPCVPGIDLPSEEFDLQSRSLHLLSRASPPHGRVVYLIVYPATPQKELDRIDSPKMSVLTY